MKKNIFSHLFMVVLSVFVIQWLDLPSARAESEALQQKIVLLGQDADAFFAKTPPFSFQNIFQNIRVKNQSAISCLPTLTTSCLVPLNLRSLVIDFQREIISAENGTKAKVLIQKKIFDTLQKAQQAPDLETKQYYYKKARGYFRTIKDAMIFLASPIEEPIE